MAGEGIPNFYIYIYFYQKCHGITLVAVWSRQKGEDGGGDATGPMEWAGVVVLPGKILREETALLDTFRIDYYFFFF